MKLQHVLVSFRVFKIITPVDDVFLVQIPKFYKLLVQIMYYLIVWRCSTVDCVWYIGCGGKSDIYAKIFSINICKYFDFLRIVWMFMEYRREEGFRVGMRLIYRTKWNNIKLYKVIRMIWVTTGDRKSDISYQFCKG